MPAARFVHPLVLAHAGDLARLKRPLVYLSAAGVEYEVPAGFESDLASIPQAAQAVISKWGRHAPACVLHDWLYCTHMTSRHEADRLFAEAMRALDVRWWEWRVMYAAVRLFGARGWRSDGARFRAREHMLRAANDQGAVIQPPSRDLLRRLYPGARDAWIDALADLGAVLGPHYGFQRLDWVHFLGQIGAETNGLTLSPLRENMTYTTAERILAVFSYRLGVALDTDSDLRTKYRTRARLALASVRNPKFLADVVYGGREGTPWMQGHRYIGRGPTQITHKNNYAAISAEIQRQPGGAAIDLVAHPDLLEQPDAGVRSAFADWHIKTLSRWARADNLDNVSSVLNTGQPGRLSIVNGLDHRRTWTARAKAALPADGGVPGDVAAAQGLREGAHGHAVQMLQTRLTELEYRPGAADGKYGRLTREAVERFQLDTGLHPDGVAGQRTLDALASAGHRAPIETRADATVADAVKSGSTQASLWTRVHGIGRWLLLGTGAGATADAAATSGVVDLSAVQAWVETGNRIKSVITEGVALVSWLAHPRYLLLGAGLLFGLWLLNLGRRGQTAAVESYRNGETS